MSEDARNEVVLEKLEALVKCLVGADSTLAKNRSLIPRAMQKLLNHNFMSINSHQVCRDVDNMVDRFRYEGMSNQADAVRDLTDLIINHESWKDHFQVDVQYSLIDFLIQMAYEPIQTLRRNRSGMSDRLVAIRDALNAAQNASELDKVPEANRAESEIDWVALLSEDFIEMTSDRCGSESSLSDWSEDSSSGESSLCAEPQNSKTSINQKDMALVYANSRDYLSEINCFVPISETAVGRKEKNFQITQPVAMSFKGAQKLDNWCTLPKLPDLQPPQPLPLYNYYKVDPEHLSRTVHSHWWRHDIKIHTLNPNNSPCANFAIAHVQHLNRHARGLIKHTVPNTVTEICLLREIIFMFFQPVSCCFFEVQPEQRLITVRPNVSIHSVSHGTLRSTLEVEVLPAIRAMYQLRHVISELLLPLSNKSSTGTLECFAVGLSDLIQPVIKRLLAFERQLIEQQQGAVALTLIEFIPQMRDQFKLLLEMQEFTSTSICPTLPSYLKSAYLLTQLHKYTRIQGSNQQIYLLLITMKRFCDISDNWWKCGQLDDYRNEYIVQFCHDENGSGGRGIRQRCVDPDSDAEQQRVQAELQDCNFYNLLLTYALELGERQVLLLSNNNLLDDLVNTSHQLGSLHKHLVQQLLKELKSCVQPKAEQCNSNAQDAACLELLQFDNQVLKSTAQQGDPELMGLFTQHLQREGTQQGQLEQTVHSSDIIDALERSNTLQLPVVILSRTLVRALRERSKLANIYVMRWYREEMLLGDHVRFLRHVLMFEADYLVYPFYTNLFRQIESGREWACTSLLTSELYDILDAHYPKMACLLYLELISRAHLQSTKVYEALDVISMVYMMPPSLSRIITEEHMVSYNKIWRLMLKVKWATWKLESMNFIRRCVKDVYSPLDLLGLTVRRLEILRFWLIYLVNALHTHLCTHVMQAIGCQFDEQLKKAATVQELVRLHHEYLLCLIKHCLLTDEFLEFSTALEQIFHLVFVLDMEWNSCLNYLNESHALSLDMSLEDTLNLEEKNPNGSLEDTNKALEYLALNQVDEIEDTYIRCHQMLANILTTLVYKHDHKFLNSLEVAVSSSMPC